MFRKKSGRKAGWRLGRERRTVRRAHWPGKGRRVPLSSTTYSIMDHQNLRNISNSFQDIRLVSLAAWRQAAEISPRDHGGPYVVLQEGYDPEDPKLTPDEFLLGRSGQWLSLAYFYQLPVEERRAEYIFGMAGEVMDVMGKLPSKPKLLRPGKAPADTSATPEADEMTQALESAKKIQS
jgi:hypothetical protein